MADKGEKHRQQNKDVKEPQMREKDGKKEYLDEETNEWVSKNEHKKRMTKRKKEMEAKEKADKKAQEPQKAGKKKVDANEDEKDPSKYTDIRKKMLQDLRNQGKEIYPHKFQKDMTIPQFRDQYEAQKISDGKFLTEKKVSITGRIYNIRSQSAKLVFIDLMEDNAKVQVFATLESYEDDFEALHKIIRRGDIVGVEGYAGRTKTSELSIRPTKIVPLSYCLHQLPNPQPGVDPFANSDTKYRQRYMDLIVNSHAKTVFETRNKIVDFIRKYLRDMDFVEVETPMMNMIPGGATARPFETHHNELDMKLYMRVAPELYLKMLVVGGMNKVFEIGKQFRNEGMDTTHNPEFTTCEFYWAYADYNDLMEMTENMLSKMVHSIHGSYKIMHTPEDGEPFEIDFSPPFKRLPMMSSLEDVLGVKMPKNSELGTEKARKFFDDLVKKKGLECKAPRSTARLVDKLVGEYLESKCKNPTFITDTPQIMSPLAKWHRSEEGLSERFELFCNYHEIINAYTELNDPKVQLEAFMKQADAKKDGDDEAQFVDQNFVQALEYGLPPTAGWGCGIDRITMLLTDKISIKDVMLFPAMKPNEPSRGAAAAARQEGQGAAAQDSCELFHSSLLQKVAPGMVAAFAGHKGLKFTKVADEAALKKDKELEKKHPLQTLPYLKTSSGDVISTSSAIMSYIGRSSTDGKLFGKNVFEEGQVYQWVAWAECLGPTMEGIQEMLFNTPKDLDMKSFNALVDELKKQVTPLNNHLKGKKWIVGDSVTMADIVCASVLTQAFQLVFDAGFRKGRADLAKWFEAFIGLPEVISSAGKISCCAKAIKPTVPTATAATAPAPAKKEEDDDLDLFGDDDDGGAAAEAAKKAAEANKAKNKKKEKKPVIAQSLVMFEVKPADSETDLDALAQRIFKISMDGLYWKTQYKKEPVAFGIFKLLIGVTVEDEKVSVDGLQEKIEEFEDMVQSVDILAFNKI